MNNRREGSGIFRRRLFAQALDGRVIAGVEDNFHHYEIEITHRDGLVTAISALSIRTPWANCPGAAAPLRALQGVKLGTDIYQREELPDPHLQCTHMYETALFAIAQAARGGHRLYDIQVPDRTLNPKVHHRTIETLSAEGRTRAELTRDGDICLAWDIEGERLLGPDPFTGQSIRRLGVWAAAHLDHDQLEAVRVLRRGVHVAWGRVVEMNDRKGAFDGYDSSIGACYVFQPENVQQGFRVRDANRDFTERPEILLSGFDERHSEARGEDARFSLFVPTKETRKDASRDQNCRPKKVTEAKRSNPNLKPF